MSDHGLGTQITVVPNSMLQCGSSFMELEDPNQRKFRMHWRVHQRGPYRETGEACSKGSRCCLMTSLASDLVEASGLLMQFKGFHLLLTKTLIQTRRWTECGY